ncbi:MAG: HupE/UreJ family protein [Pseudomonadota bacterium]
MKKISSRIAFLLIAALPALAQAHPGHDAGISFASGAMHPLTGIDHLLALLAVGLLAARMGGRALLAIPAAFLALLAVGIALGFEGVQLDYVEPAILASILICGALAALPPRHLPVATAALAALFAIFHGNAHGMEVVAGLVRMEYATGLMTGSALVIGITAFATRSATWATSAPRR